MVKQLTHKEVSRRGGLSTAKKLGKKGLSERGRRMAEAKKAKMAEKRKYENLSNMQKTSMEKE